MEQEYVIDKRNRRSKPKSPADPKTLRIVSLILAIIPLALILFCIIASKGESENGAGAIMWLVVLYYWSLGIPVAVASLVTGVVSFVKEKHILSLISIILTLLPFVYFVIAMYF